MSTCSCCEQDEEELVHQPDSLVEATVDSILEKDDSRCGIARKEGELVPYQPLEVSTTHQHFITDRYVRLFISMYGRELIVLS